MQKELVKANIVVFIASFCTLVIELVGGAEFQTSLMVRILLITAIVFFIPSCILGMISPVVVKLTLHNLQKTGNVVGKIYAFSTLGSILGTFATGFFLIQWMGTRNILLTMGAILIVSAPIFGNFFQRKKVFAIFFLSLFVYFIIVFPLAVWGGYSAVYPERFFIPTSPR